MRKIFILCVFMVTVVYAERPFVTAEFRGQLGNQFFIIAAATSLALDHNADAIFPELQLRGDSEIPENYEKVFFRLNTSALPKPSKRSWRERSHAYTPIIYRPNMVLKGFFQSEKYFKHHKEKILALFEPHPDVMSYLEEKYGEILDHPYAVGIHVRTYHKEDPKHEKLQECTMRYFEKAMSLFRPEALFVIFSDDIAWCKEKFHSIDRPCVFIEGESHIHDFFLLSRCKHQIISNSTFSWWAAYLNPSIDKVVVAPRKWFKSNLRMDERDITPEGWLMMENTK